jgi:hypothetical protein
MEQGRQTKRVMARQSGPAKGWELVIPNPKLKLMDQVRKGVTHSMVRFRSYSQLALARV